MNELNWYAVHVRSRHEFQVFDRLTGAGVEAFLPSVEKLRRWKDRNKRIDFPLFPGYLFVHIEKSQQGILTVLKTKGVVRLLGSEPGNPEHVPEEQIHSLKTVLDAGAQLDPYPYLQEGQRIRITRGALAGVEGHLVQKTGRHMLILSVDVLRQGVSLTIDASEVEPA